MSRIAVFDSGLGGLTVLSELKRILPGENYIYFGDSANAPYGDKTPDVLFKLCTDVCSKLIDTDDIKCFVIACNTTTSAIWDRLTERFRDYDFVGIEPAVKQAAHGEPGKNILVLATTATVSGSRLKNRIAEYKDKANITALAASGIVPYVESLKKDKPAFMAYLDGLLKEYRDDTDAVVLGCTHFPFVKSELRSCFSKNISFYDPAVVTAAETRALLSAKGKLNDQDRHGSVIFLNSDPSKVSVEEKLLSEYR